MLRHEIIQETERLGTVFKRCLRGWPLLVSTSLRQRARLCIAHVKLPENAIGRRPNPRRMMCPLSLRNPRNCGGVVVGQTPLW